MMQCYSGGWGGSEEGNSWRDGATSETGVDGREKAPAHVVGATTPLERCSRTMGGGGREGARKRKRAVRAGGREFTLSFFRIGGWGRAWWWASGRFCARSVRSLTCDHSSS